MKALIILSILFLVSTHSSLTIGSCQKFSLDGQTCQRCVDHFHLYQGACYVDILGCQEYTFGNICHSCENGYILVNNLCCDHNCLAKLFKRHDSGKTSKTINQNTQTFSKIIPFINQHYIKGAMQNLVQIQYQTYIDVTRYVLLYEFPSGKFKMRRAVVDYVKDSQQIIMVDWSNVQDIHEFMNFHKDQIELQTNEQANKVILQVFHQKPIVSHIRKFKLTQIEQYEIVINNLDKQQVIYRTFYLKSGRTLNLLTQISAMPQFMPTQAIIQSKDLPHHTSINKSLKQVIKMVKADHRYKKDIHHVLIKQKNRFVKQYIVFIQNIQQDIEFFLFENLKDNSIKIVDYIRKQREVLKPIVNKVVENIDVSGWKNIQIKNQKTEIHQNPKLTATENKVIEIVQQAVKNVKLQKHQQRRLSQCKQVHCEIKEIATLPIEGEQMSVLRMFRQKNPNLVSFELTETWAHQFKTFTEWSILVKVQTKYIYFHAIEFLDSKTFVFWGQSQTKSPQINSEGLYQLVNEQENVPQSKVEDARAVITSKYPETKNLQVRKTILRSFPQNRKRYIIVLRHPTSTIRYIVLSDSEKTWLQQNETIQINIEQLTPSIQTLTQVQHKLQVIVEQVHHGKQIDPQVSLSKVDPIVVKHPQNSHSQTTTTTTTTTTRTDSSHKDTKNIKVINEIRQNNKNLQNFEIVHSWTSKIEGGKQRQTFLIKPTHENQQHQQNTEQVFQYHTIVKNAQTDEMIYVGHQTMDAIVEDQQGLAIQPQKVIKLVEKKTQTKKVVEQHKPIEQIKHQIVESVIKVKDIEKVTKKVPSKIQAYIHKVAPESTQWTLLKLWSNTQFKTYVEHTLLFNKGQSFVFVYIFEWLQNQTFAYVGKNENRAPQKGNDGQFTNPNNQHKFESQDLSFLTNVIVQKFPEIVENQVENVVQRIFPTLKRYTVILRTSTKRLKYVLHVHSQSAQLIQWQTLQQNLPVITKQVKVIQQIITKTIKNVHQDKKQQKRLSDCKDVHCQDRKQPTLPIEHQQSSIVKLFRQKNPTLKSFELVQTWTHNFKTFVEWTILVKVTQNNQITYIYFDAIYYLDKKQYQFWGQTRTSSPLLSINGKYLINNPQEHVPQSKVSQARTIINSRFPEVTHLQARKTLLRQFPDHRNRVVIVLRHEHSKVRYVVLNNSSKTWLQEYQIIQQNLQKEIQQQTELKHKLQVIATQIEHHEKIDKQVNMQKSNQQITITHTNTKQQQHTNIHNKQPHPVTPQHVSQQFQTKHITHATISGTKTQNTRSMSQKDHKIVNKIKKLHKPTSTSTGKTTKTIKTHTIYTTQQVQTIQNIEPLTVIQQQFCDFNDILIIYEVQHNIYVFAYRYSLTNQDDVQFLGKYIFVRQNGMTDQQIIDKSTKIRSNTYNKDNAITTLTHKHNNLTGLIPLSYEVKQFGDYIRATFVYNSDHYLTRYLISQSPQGTYSIIQQCRLKNTKQVHTQTKVTVTGQTSISTNDIPTIIKQDQTVKQVIENVKKQINSVKDSEVVNVKITDYQKKTQYVVNFQTHDSEEVLTQKQVSVVHDKIKHSNDIIAVQIVHPEPILVQQHKPIEQHKPVLQHKPVQQHPVQNTQQTTTTTATIQSSQSTTTTTTPTQTHQVQIPMLKQDQTYIVVLNKPTTTTTSTTTSESTPVTQTVTPTQIIETTTVTKVIHPQVIQKITQQIKISQNIQQKDMHVKQILVQAHDENKKIEKVQQIVQNIVTGQNILVTAIVNKQTHKVIVEDIKPIQNHIVKHLQPVQLPQPVQQQKQVVQKQQPVVIKVQQIQQVLVQVQQQIQKKQDQVKVCDEIAAYVNSKQSTQTQQTPILLENPRPVTLPQVPIIINPQDIQSVVQQVKDSITVVDTSHKVQKFTPLVSQTKQQAINYLQTIKPQTETATIISTTTQILPTSVVTHIIQQTPINTIYATVQKTQENGSILSDYIKVKNTNEKTIQTVITEVQKQDTAGYQPIDPQITNMVKATQIVASHTTHINGNVNNEFEQKIDISKSDEKIEQIVQAVRTQYPITKTAPVISASQTKISATTSQIKVDFYVAGQDNTYKVDQAKVQVSNLNNDQTYTVTTFTQVVNNGVQTNIVLDKIDPVQLPNIINAAYGYQKLQLTTAAKNIDIQTIQSQIQRRYSQFVAGQPVTQIQVLQLKNGKVNYIFRYKSAYFTIYWDSILKRIIFLNQVSTISRTQFNAVKDNDYYTNGLAYIANIHQSQMKNYKTLTTGQYINGINIVFQIQFLSGNRKYRSIFQVNKQTMDTTQLLFIELIELTMKDNSLKQIKLISDIYQKIDANSYKSNRYFTMVDQYAKNRNQMLINAKVLGVSYKPQSLGFSFKITYKLQDSRLLETQIYIQTFSQKYSQTSIKLIDFDAGFSTAQVPKIDMDKILQSIASKSSIVLTTGQYAIDEVQAKEMLFGYLFKITATINNVQYEGLVYVDSASGENSLINWKVKLVVNGCQVKADDSQQCKKCANGFILSVDLKTCLREIEGCQVYGDNKLTCNVCKTGFEKLNNICTKDCGILCKAVAYP